MPGKLKMPVIWDNPAFAVQDGEIYYSVNYEGMLIATPQVYFRVSKGKRDTFLTVCKKGDKRKDIFFRLDDLGCGSVEVQQPKDMPDAIWLKFMELYQRFLPLHERHSNEQSHKQFIERQIEAATRTETLAEIESALQ